MTPRIYGHIPDIPTGMLFEDRRALHDAGVHRPLVAGISYAPDAAAESIVLSGGYEDDHDDGEVIVYTGQGGNDPATKTQVADQPLTRGNLALVRSLMDGVPVRVIRGASHRSPLSPPQGYRYDGLYAVEAYWQARGRSGFLIWRYRLRRIEPTVETELFVAESRAAYGTPNMPTRRLTTVSRIVRNTVPSARVKVLHDFHCQMCGTRLWTPAGPYAEGAHIRPLGLPHNGPDTLNNILCLCPNHHILFDLGAVAINTDLSLRGMDGELRTSPAHPIDPAHIAYHSALIQYSR